MFDFYHRWLAIPKGQRPPTYYQLLGVSPVETDSEVIAEAALRQTSHVRTYQTGPYAQQCQTLLNDIGQAKVTLLHPAKRKEYDARLRKITSDGACEPPNSVTAPESRDRSFDFSAPATTEHVPASVRRPGFRSGIDPLALAYFAILLVGAALAFWLSNTTP
jgi:hypothetical protein